MQMTQPNKCILNYMQNIIGIHLKFYHILFYALYIVYYSRKNKCKTQRQPKYYHSFLKETTKRQQQGHLNSIQVGSNECYLLLQQRAAHCTEITKPHEIIVNTFFVSVSVSFCMFSCSKGHLIRAYLGSIKMPYYYPLFCTIS